MLLICRQPSITCSFSPKEFQLQELKAAGDVAWEDLKIGAEKAWAEAKSAFHNTASGVSSMQPGKKRKIISNYYRTRKGGFMEKIGKRIIILCALALFAFAQIGCEREGTAEKAGKNIDKALDTAKEKVDDATK